MTTPENVQCPTCDGERYVWDDEDGGSYDCHDCTPENVKEQTVTDGAVRTDR